MLVLTRRVGEEIVIAGNIRVKVVAILGRRIRVGITAPRSVPVSRLELLQQCSNGAAGQPPDDATPAPGKEAPRATRRPDL
jgi:carbon storage regulator